MEISASLAFQERISALQSRLEQCSRAVSCGGRASCNRTEGSISPQWREKGQALLRRAQEALNEFLELAVQVTGRSY